MTSSASPRYNNIFPDTRSFSKIERVLDVPDLIDVQKDSFNWFTGKGLTDLLEEISPIEDNRSIQMDLRGFI